MAEVKEDGTVDRGRNRHPEDRSNWEEANDISGRPNDIASGNTTFASRSGKAKAPERLTETNDNSTFAERKAAQAKARKAIKGDDAEDKSVKKASSK